MRPTAEEVEKVIQECIDLEGVSNLKGMTYEEGIIAALEWYFEEGEHPLRQ